MAEDRHVIAAFRRGRMVGMHRPKFGRDQCPYGPKRDPELRDAWLAGFDYGWQHDYWRSGDSAAEYIEE